MYIGFGNEVHVKSTKEGGSTMLKMTICYQYKEQKKAAG